MRMRMRMQTWSSWWLGNYFFSNCLMLVTGRCGPSNFFFEGPGHGKMVRGLCLLAGERKARLLCRHIRQHRLVEALVQGLTDLTGGAHLVPVER